jgi:hypothetical protein
LEPERLSEIGEPGTELRPSGSAHRRCVRHCAAIVNKFPRRRKFRFLSLA